MKMIYNFNKLKTFIFLNAFILFVSSSCFKSVYAQEIDITTIGLSKSTYQKLIVHNINYVSQLILYTEKGLLDLPNLGSGTLDQIKTQLSKIGQTLKIEESVPITYGDDDLRIIMPRLNSLYATLRREGITRHSAPRNIYFF